MTARPRRILVVDDDDDVRSSIAQVLEEEGWDVREASDGREAIDLVAQFEPAVVLLDWRMPGLDGGQVLERMDRWRDRLQVVLVTASSDGPDLAARHGVAFQVTKPFDLDALLSVVTRAHEA